MNGNIKIKYLYICINILILIINLFMVYHYKIIHLLFKSCDEFSIGLSNRTYKDISNYLNNKYNNKNYLILIILII